MSNFWERALGTPPAVPRQEPVTTQARPWWTADGLTEGSPAAPPPGPADELAGHDFSKATHLKQTGTCPECDSGNLAITGKVTTRNGTVEAQRCFDCGWPVAHSTRGLSGTSGGAADGHARQTDTGGAVVHNYQPQNTAAGAIRSVSDLR